MRLFIKFISDIITYNLSPFLKWNIPCSSDLDHTKKVLQMSNLWRNTWSVVRLDLFTGASAVRLSRRRRMRPGPQSIHLAERRLTAKSRTREIKCYNDRIALKFDKHLGSSAAEVLVKLQSDWKCLNPILAASETSGDLAVYIYIWHCVYI